MNSRWYVEIDLEVDDKINLLRNEEEDAEGIEELVESRLTGDSLKVMSVRASSDSVYPDPDGEE